MADTETPAQASHSETSEQTLAEADDKANGSSDVKPMAKSQSDAGGDVLRTPAHAITAPATTGRMQNRETLGQMAKGRSTIIGWKPHPDDLRALRERRYMSGLFHLNTRLDLLDAGHHIKDEEPGANEPGANAPDPNVVVFSGPDDPLNSQNWSTTTKVIQTALLGLATVVVTFASSVFSTATIAVAQDFGVSTEVSVLGTSLFLAGYCVGPSLWGPASEFLGRKTPIVFSYFGFMIFQIPVAVAQNLETVMLGRFFGGVFASGPLAIVAGCFSDFWSAEARGAAITVYCVAAVAGPAIGPVCGNFITQSYLGWRFTAWVTMWWAALMLILLVFFMKESFAPIILQKRAKQLRFETKNWAIRSKLDEKQFSGKQILKAYVMRPVTMFFQEPVLFAVTVYSSFVYGILYLLFGAVPYVFVEQRGWEPGKAGLVFISVFIGGVTGGAITLLFNPRYNHKLHTTHRIACPEERTLPMMLGAVIFPIGCFLFGWTCPLYVSSPWPEIVAIGMISCGFVLIFLSSLNLLVDVYLPLANTAISANTVIRSGVAAGFPLFGTIMYENEGTQWASTILGCLAVIMAPIPVAFWFYGPAFIARSKFAPTPPSTKPQGDPEKKA